MESTSNRRPLTPWNKGKIVAQKTPFKLKEIWAIRIRLQLGHRTRELAMFDLGLDWTSHTTVDTSWPQIGQHKVDFSPEVSLFGCRDTSDCTSQRCWEAKARAILSPMRLNFLSDDIDRGGDAGVVITQEESVIRCDDALVEHLARRFQLSGARGQHNHRPLIRKSDEGTLAIDIRQLNAGGALRQGSGTLAAERGGGQCPCTACQQVAALKLGGSVHAGLLELVFVQKASRKIRCFQFCAETISPREYRQSPGTPALGGWFGPDAATRAAASCFRSRWSALQ